MAALASFWVGDRLGPIEIASARSFLRQGERLTIYAPGPVADVPEGVRLADSRDVLPGDRIVRHRRTGSPALHSDLFRYALLARTGEIWVDLDMIALRPFDFPSAHVFAWERTTLVNGAVLSLPPDSPALQALRAFGPDHVGLPPAMRGLRRAKYWLRSGGRGLPIDRWPWGSLGPRALTHILRQTGEIAHALPRPAFYAIPQREAARFAQPGALRRADLPGEAWGVHLWANDLRAALPADGSVPPGSFLDLALTGQI